MLLPTTTRNVACNSVVDLLDAGSGPGYVEILTSADAVLATITLNDPAFGDAGASVAGQAAVDLSGGLSDPSCDASGTAAKFRAYDSDANLVEEGTVGTSGADMIVPTTTVVAGQPFEITAWTVTMPAS